MRPPARPIRRLLVANRGEIAIRILQAARELIPMEDGVAIETFAPYTEGDQTHCDVGRPDHRILLPSPGSYMDISLLVNIVKQHAIDAVHPGYGFLSESADFARRLWDDAGAVLVGPGWEILEQMGNKLHAKTLAVRSGVPVLPAMETSSGDVNEIGQFANKVNYPVMIKAVDGGGGRGIRLVKAASELSNAVSRAKGESPSGTVFVEKAAINGFHHVEVQIIGDGTGRVRHLWERDCSVQRRFQKIVEYAPSVSCDRETIRDVIDAAVKMASDVHYFSLGTFEFLVHESSKEFFFLEINPRLQVEHTITECISGIDLVQTQLLLAQGLSLDKLGLGDMQDPYTPPKQCSIQLRLCAEVPESDFSLSIGNITQFVLPRGNGVRVDTHFSSTSPTLIGFDFDNLLAKIIVTAADWNTAILKARRALGDIIVSGVKTNLDLLRAIIDSDFLVYGNPDTQWLERNLPSLLSTSQRLSEKAKSPNLSSSTNSLPQGNLVAASSSVLFRKGDAWSLTLEPLSEPNPNGNPSSDKTLQSHILLKRVLRNEFPSSLTAEVEYTASSSSSPSTTPYRLHLTETNASSSAITSASHRRGDPSNPAHLVSPLSGKLLEVLVAEGDEIAQDQVVAYIKQMKMELEVRSHRSGVVKWVVEVDLDSHSQGIDVAEGHLLLELEDSSKEHGQRQSINTRGKL
ncbi:PycA protein [Talaromyces proteolyticus]|uniref:PycA protein n=1 Tax=Talaromyces proteolyticus TaxID=1131652 RepID=A0AAD4KYA4_9EURO|nr:PycA protein [Talaromyces proteolyticus]KAH8703162.1 PycA protein [Talaromyces proteolyticus]